MKTCNLCNMRLWSTDKGVCPTCFPLENRAVYGLKVTPEPQPVIINSFQPRGAKVPTFIPPKAGTLADVVRGYILQTYEESEGNKAKVARTLGISIKTLYNHLDRYGVA
jgi:DNA-binding NtrC family response regulator